MANLKLRWRMLKLAITNPHGLSVDLADLKAMKVTAMQSAIKQYIESPADKRGLGMRGNVSVFFSYSEIEAELERRFLEGA